ncbi:transglutaminase family protein [Stieleria varia]|uniref:DUF2126 domain-containing protein n=1 Tax=Stieleria varia TaxID=2528005 RepID=A0A5C6BAX7_9BACT|nr:transglutaminase family protein [Stieleria varia]TWU08416.1 hypothetical protein Pla52n_09990 [Stieleria varia]
MPLDDDVLRALETHDAAVEDSGLSVWVGAEPTYTDRFSESPEWLFDALGDTKHLRAESLLGRIARERVSAGAVILRTVGRQYGGEPLPRWSIGLYSRRDGTPLWSGPHDPILACNRKTMEERMPQDAAATIPALAECLAENLRSEGINAAALAGELAGRVVFSADDQALPMNSDEESALARSSVHKRKVKDAEVKDLLSARGTFLVICRRASGDAEVELPAVGDVALFALLLKALSKSANEVGISALVIMGYPPPVDETVAWMTVTPDPAVIEINMAPAPRTAELLSDLRCLERSAADEGLQSYRLQYNGMETDSGGGGQVTLGGPSAVQSPFFVKPHLLPNLVRYFNRHPSLSYLHAPESVGPASQAPRADEGVRGALPELSLSLELLSRVPEPLPETIWSTLAPYLADPSGNSHRAEINIEKLWNPFLGSRGRQGLVEFRAFRMGASAETTASLAALLRSIVAMLAKEPRHEKLVDWGDSLHQRYSLPFYLHLDLQEVLTDLAASGFALNECLNEYLFRDRDLLFIQRDFGDVRLELRRALEFWPLVGDVATQESGGSRFIDASTSRMEIRLRSAGAADTLNQWSVTAHGWNIPLCSDVDDSGPARVAGVRYCTFKPTRGLHPTLETQVPLRLTLSHPQHGAWQIEVHEWEPQCQPYPGLPRTLDEARSRREQRCVVSTLDKFAKPAVTPPPDALGQYVVDLRWC